MLPKPPALLPIVRKNGFHLCPEPGGMVHFLSVAQLVDNDIVQYILRRQHQQAVEIQISGGRAAAPPGPLGPDGDTVIVYAQNTGIVPDFWWDEQLRLPGQFPHFGIRQNIGLRRKPVQMGQDPVPAAVHKMLYFPFGKPLGTPHQNVSPECDLNGNGFPAAAEDPVFHGQRIHRKSMKVGTSFSQSASQCPPPIWQSIYTAAPRWIRASATDLLWW